jgi:hypothetical protein
MTDFNSPNLGRDAGEPARDARLAALLRDVVGDPSVIDVDWHALSGRIAAAIRMPHTAPWWSYVERWQRRALPLALAAGLAGALAFWGTTSSQRAEGSANGTTDLVSAVATGTAPADAATSFARSITNTDDLVVDGAPE